MDRGRIVILIPAYNEEDNISSILKQVKGYVKRGFSDKIFVIDDASTDGTGKKAEKIGVDVITHTLNRGYGAAQRTGHHLCIEAGFKWILQMDADGQHDPKYIPILLKTAIEGDYDITLGSRFLNKSHKNFSLARRCGISFFTQFVRKMCKVDITDITSGFKVYKVEMLKALHTHSDKNPAVEQMLEIARSGFKIKEVSVKMPVRENGESHLSLRRFLFYPLRAIYLVTKVILFR